MQCLNRERLIAFQMGLATDDEIAHVEACPLCLQHLDELPEERDDFQKAIWAAAAEPLDDGVLAALGVGVTLRVLATAGAPETSAHSATPLRYELLGEIARGGMGVVLHGRDAELGRDVAFKVLLEKHKDSPALRQRFVEEARIAGQLQHPGVAPVYEVGQFGDRRPCFTMKLVKGRDLAALLAQRTDPSQELPRFLKVFEQVCQTVAYAHSRGVIHRDLKPANVMVGDFGEVLVMDWGLAKVLKPAGAEAEPPAAAVPEACGGTQVGTVLGTPAYMAPEQARGENTRLDERCDVFGLGAILCEILTGKPPYLADETAEVRSKAVAGDLKDAMGRLAASGAHEDLRELAERCLALTSESRPRHAGQVAAAVLAYQAAVQERLRQAEFERGEAQAKALHERRRRRWALALTASALLTLAILVGGGWWLERQQVETERLKAHAVRRAAESRYYQAIAQDSRGQFDEAVAALRRAIDLKPDYGEAYFYLGYILQKQNKLDQAIAAYRKVIELDGEDASAYANLGLALEDEGKWDEALAVYRKAIELKQDDPQLYCNLGVAFSHQGKWDEAIRAYRKAIELKNDYAWAFSNLGNALWQQGNFDDAVAAYRRAVDLKPNGAEVHYNLGYCLAEQGKLEEAVGAYRKAVDAKHDYYEAYNNLGNLYWRLGRLDEAVAACDKAISIKADHCPAHFNLGIALTLQGNLDEAAVAFDTAKCLEKNGSMKK